MSLRLANSILRSTVIALILLSFYESVNATPEACPGGRPEGYQGFDCTNCHIGIPNKSTYNYNCADYITKVEKPIEESTDKATSDSTPSVPSVYIHGSKTSRERAREIRANQ